MKLVKTSAGTVLRFTYAEWQSIGRQAGWLNEAAKHNQIRPSPFQQGEEGQDLEQYWPETPKGDAERDFYSTSLDETKSMSDLDQRIDQMMNALGNFQSSDVDGINVSYPSIDPNSAQWGEIGDAALVFAGKKRAAWIMQSAPPRSDSDLLLRRMMERARTGRDPVCVRRDVTVLRCGAGVMVGSEKDVRELARLAEINKKMKGQTPYEVHAKLGEILGYSPDDIAKSERGQRGLGAQEMRSEREQQNQQRNQITQDMTQRQQQGLPVPDKSKWYNGVKPRRLHQELVPAPELATTAKKKKGLTASTVDEIMRRI